MTASFAILASRVFEMNAPTASETTYAGKPYEFDWSTRYTGPNLAGIYVMGYSKKNNKIYGNTFYISSPNHLYGIAMLSKKDIAGMQIKNNIVYMALNNAAVYPLYIADYDDFGTLPIVQYNNLYGTHSNRVRIEENLAAGLHMTQPNKQHGMLPVIQDPYLRILSWLTQPQADSLFNPHPLP